MKRIFGNKIESDPNDLKRNKAGDQVTRTQKREPQKLKNFDWGHFSK